MSYLYPNYPGDVAGGDEATYSPAKIQHSLLGSERGTQHTKRFELDANNNLFVRIAGDDSKILVAPLAVGNVTNIPDGTLITIVTYTAPSDKKITKISVSGTDYAKFQLFKNTVLIDTKRSGPERSVEFVFSDALSLANSDILDVKVTHYAPSVLADFESTVYGA
jgi:hypothetical protein